MRPRVYLALAFIALFGCSSTPFVLEEEALRNGLIVDTFSDSRFDLRIYSKVGDSDYQVVFIEGDGRPWTSNGRESSGDPTPRSALAFSLMTQTNVFSHYVTRPCYFQLLGAGCRTEIWTSARFSDEVVSVMTQALKSKLSPNVPLVLIGYSGGGALALLIGSRIEREVLVVTVAGLVDTDAWTQYHGYQSLTGSINPATDELVKKLRQIHLIAARDKIVPPEQTQTAVGGWPDSTYRSFPKFDHVCCWETEWPEIWPLIEAEISHPARSY